MKTIIGVIFLVFMFLIAMTAIDMGSQYVSSAIFSAPTETVSATSVQSVISVSITGQVYNTGTYSLSSESTLEDLIEAAGGVTNEADSDCYNLYLDLEDGMDIYIAKLTDSDKVCINEAELDELTTLSGIGKTIGNRIITFRETYGDFEYLEQIMEVDGVGKTIFNNIKDKICL